MATETEVGGKLGVTNHGKIRFRLKWKVETDLNPTKVPNFRCSDFEDIRAELSICWESLFEESGQRQEGINQRAREGEVAITGTLPPYSNYWISLGGGEKKGC